MPKDDDLRSGDDVLVRMKFWRHRTFPEGTSLVVCGDEFDLPGNDYDVSGKFIQVKATDIIKPRNDADA